jgi:hypothetical protein
MACEARNSLGAREVMPRQAIISFYIDSTKEPQHVVLIAMLRKLGASLVRDSRIHAYVQTEDGREYLSSPCSEGMAFDTVGALFTESKIAAVDAEVDHEGRAMLFSFDPSYDGQITITILGECVELPDRMIDFNWYYTFWKNCIGDLVDIAGVEFSVHA